MPYSVPIVLHRQPDSAYLPTIPVSIIQRHHQTAQTYSFVTPVLLLHSHTLQVLHLSHLLPTAVVLLKDYYTLPVLVQELQCSLLMPPVWLHLHLNLHSLHLCFPVQLLCSHLFLVLNFEYIHKHSDTVHLLPDIYLPDHLKRPADFFVSASMYPQTLQSALMLLAHRSSCHYILHMHLPLPLLLQNFSL